MACQSCEATFATLDAQEANVDQSRALKLDQAQPKCRCQMISVSPHSPAPIENLEVLVRILVAPQHMGGKGLPKAAALSDAERNGLSVFRREETANEQIRKVAEGLVARARANTPESRRMKVGVFGVLMLTCGEVRAFKRDDEADPCYCVYDTALADIRGHAEVFQQIADISDEIRLDRRQKLFAIVKTHFIPVDKFQNGLLADLAPQPPSG